MSSTATAATARLITATAKAMAPGVRFATTSQGPIHFRVVLHDTLLSGLSEYHAAGLATHGIQGVDGGSRFTATWGRDHRSGKLVITVTDETTREQLMEEQEARRVAALERARAEVAAIEARRATAAEETPDPLRCAACGKGADSEAHAHDHAYVIGNELGTEGTRLPEEPAPWAPEVVAPSGRYGYRQVEPFGYERDLPVVMVVQRFADGSWGPTPARYYADTAAAVTAPRLLIDCGAGWELSEADTTGLVAYAAERAPAPEDEARFAECAAGRRCGHYGVCRCAGQPTELSRGHQLAAALDHPAGSAIRTRILRDRLQ